MDTIPSDHKIKLKDVTKLFSKTFAGSSSIKDNNNIIIQGDHVLDVAELLIDKLHIDSSYLFFDFDNNQQLVPYNQ
jgi:density-regulated protein